MGQQAERADGGFARGRTLTAVMRSRFVLTRAGHEALRRAELADLQGVLDQARGSRAGGRS